MSFYFRKTLTILWRLGSCERPGHHCSSSHYYFCFFHSLNVPRLPVCATLWCQCHSCRGVDSSLHHEQEQITNSHIALARHGKSHLLSTQCRGVPSLSSLDSEHIELATSELPRLRKYRILKLPSIPFPFLIVFSNTDYAALNSSPAVIKSRSFQVNPQCPQTPWMLPAGWSHYESSRSITVSTEPGGAKISDVLPGRRIKLLLWRLGFVQEKRRISAQRELPPRRGKGIPLVLGSTGLTAGMQAGLPEEVCNLSACNNQCITAFLREKKVCSKIHWSPCSVLCQSFPKDLLSRQAKIQFQLPATLSYRKQKPGSLLMHSMTTFIILLFSLSNTYQRDLWLSTDATNYFWCHARQPAGGSHLLSFVTSAWDWFTQSIDWQDMLTATRIGILGNFRLQAGSALSSADQKYMVM